MSPSTDWAENATLVGPPIAILIAFLGWRFRARREIEVEKPEATLINAPQNSDDLKLLVRHRGAEIEQPVVSALVVVRNTGNRDISRADFVEPFTLFAPPNHQILSCRFGAPPGVKLDPSNEMGDFQDNPQAVYVRWNLLKPRQRIVFRLIMSKTDQKFAVNAEEAISHTALLKDVKSRSGIYSAVNRYLFYVLLGVVGVCLSAFLTPQVKAYAHTFLKPNGEKVVMASKNSEATKLCLVLDGPTSPEKCERISNEEANSLTYAGMEHVAWQSRFPIKVSNYWWLFAFPFVFVAFDYRRDALRAVRRFFQVARS